MTEPRAGAPSDNDTLQSVLAALAEEGYDGEANAVEGGTVHLRRCGHDVGAAELAVEHVRRMEGASDPDDMLAVMGITCPQCGDKASLVVHYGPTAGPADADVLVDLPI